MSGGSILGRLLKGAEKAKKSRFILGDFFAQ
jgi:hypothetical protein